MKMFPGSLKGNLKVWSETSGLTRMHFRTMEPLSETGKKVRFKVF